MSFRIIRSVALCCVISPVFVCPLVAANDPTADLAGGITDASMRGSLSATLRPLFDLKLSSRAEGVIEKFHVAEGATVKAGDPIISLDANIERAEVLQAEAAVTGATAELARTEAELERIKPLSNERIYSDKQLIEAKTATAIARSRVDQANASLEMAKARLSNRIIFSPIDGIFLKTNKSMGEAVARFETVARVVDVSVLEMVVYCDGRYFDTLKSISELKVKILKENADQPVVSAKVVHVDPIIDPSSATFRVKLQLAHTGVAAPGYPATILLP